MMKKLFIFVFFNVVFFNQAWALDTEQRIKNSREAIKLLGSELKTTLKASMKTKGPVESISVCNVSALKIAKSVSDKKGFTVARTSLKNRNKENQADNWEKKVLEQFEQRKAKGEDIKKMEFSEVVEHKGKKVFRYMKAIPTGDICLKCHGDNIAPPIAEKINSLYPEDKASGFKKGDIRGAFSVIQAVD